MALKPLVSSRTSAIPPTGTRVASSPRCNRVNASASRCTGRTMYLRTLNVNSAMRTSETAAQQKPRTRLIVPVRSASRWRTASSACCCRFSAAN